MSQLPNSQPDATAPVTSIPPAAAEVTSEISADEIAKGKLFALLSYACNFINVPFWVVPLFMRDNRFSLYHAKQCLTLFIFVVPAAIVSAILIYACVGIVLLPAVLITNVVFMVIGMMNVSNQLTKPLPFIGKFGEKWFANIKINTPPTAPM
ncbi:MAG TPA: DUF4870 domain-containing protein [Phycisphaerales bacterium]|nr:DUF4870 domain-containing protein [Phycisphaerales bacterium]